MGGVARFLLEDRKRKAEALADFLRSRPRVVVPIDYGLIERCVLDGMAGYVVRDTPWQRIKSSDPRRIATSMALHYFGRFRVSPHFDRVWGDCYDRIVKRAANPVKFSGKISGRTETVQDAINHGFEETGANELARKMHYVCIATGGSLHKDYMKPVFTRQETHRFVNAPAGLTWLEAQWYAVAFCAGADHGSALRICRVKFSQFDGSVVPENIEIARLFARSTPMSIHDLDDVIDYVRMRRTENAAYSLKGRTLEALHAQTLEWHRDTARSKKIGTGTWSGVDVPDWARPQGQDQSVPEWRMTQIVTGADLAAEGNRMRHCVNIYKPSCINGQISIWSLTCDGKRALTIELRTSGLAVIQARGLANRSPRPDETAVLQQWAAQVGARLKAVL